MIKICSTFLNKVHIHFVRSRRFSSYLYVTGDKAREIYSSVQPQIDFDERIENVSKLEEDIKRRKCDLDIHEVKTLWDFYKTRLDHKQKLESNRKETKLALEKSITNNTNGSNDNEIDSLKLRFKLIRDDLKNITKTIWDIENNVVIKVLQVPNSLHSRTPDEEIIVNSFNDKVNSGNDHLQIGKHLNCLQYNDKSSYYLKNDLALFEVTASEYITNIFKSYGYIPTCNTDFGRSVLIEGCTLKSYSPDTAFILKNTDKDKKDKLYLSGGASYIPFYGFHTKQVAQGGTFPICYVTSGKQYNPTPSNDFSGLYSVWQSSAVEIFISTIDENNLTEVYDNAVQNVTDLYKLLDIHFRIVNVPAADLKPWERLRTAIQLYSPVHKAYIEVGNLSLIGDFISKRLKAYSAIENNLNFLHVISGTVIKMPVLIANLLETSSKTELHIPKVIKEEMAQFKEL